MDSVQTIILFFLQFLFFLIVLVVCLRLAAKKHRDQLLSLLKHTDKSKDAEGNLDDHSNQSIASQLNHKIVSLSKEMLAYNKLKLEYKKIKTEFETLSNTLSSAKEFEIEELVHPVESGRMQETFGYLPSKEDLEKCTDTLNSSSNHLLSLMQFIRELKSIIRVFEEKNQQSDSDTNETIKKLENSIQELQTYNEELKDSISELKQKLEEAKTSETLESQNTEAESDDVQSESEENPTDTEEPTQTTPPDYEKIKKEVVILRENTTKQRQLIFTLEEQIIALKNNISSSSMSEEEQKEYDEKINQLHKLVKESETCIEVLENEVSFLNDQLSNHDYKQEFETLKIKYDDKLNEFKRMQVSLDRATSVRTKLREIIALALIKNPKEALDLAAKKILETFSATGVDIHFKIVTQLGEVEESNSPDFTDEQKELLSMTIHKNPDSTVETEDGFIHTQKQIGVFAKAKLTDETSLGKLQDTISFILLISNTVITLIDENQATITRLKALKRLVDGVRSKIGALSVQAKYQSDEAKQIFDSLIKELNNCLNTMNITENQSLFFDQMLTEAKARMDILLQSDVVVDKSFAELLDNIEKSTHYID